MASQTVDHRLPGELVHLASSIRRQLMTREEALDRARAHPAFFPEPAEIEETLEYIRQVRYADDSEFACLIAWLYLEVLEGKQLRLGPVWLPAAMTFIECAADYLVAAPDAPLFQRAECTVAEMIGTFRSAGGEVPPTVRPHQVLTCAAALYTRPFAGEVRSHDLRHGYEIWLNRSRNEVWSDPRRITDYEIPDIEEAIETAESLLEEAESFADGPDRGRVMADRARLEVGLADLRGQPWPRSAATLVTQAMKLLHADADQLELLELALLLTTLTKKPEISARVYAVRPIHEAIAEYGPAKTLRFLTLGARVASFLNCADAEAWLAEAARLPVDFGTEADRGYLWAIAGHHLPGDVLGCPAERLDLGAAVWKIESMGLPPRPFAAALAHLAYHSFRQAPNDLVDRALTLDPQIIDSPAFRYLWLAVVAEGAQSALREGDHASAAEDVLTGLSLAASLALTEKVVGLLELLITVIHGGRGTSVPDTADAMIGIGPSLVDTVGEVCRPQLLDLYAALAFGLADDPGRLLAVHQLAKGHEFSRLVSDPGPIPDRLDEEERLAQVRAVESAEGPGAINYLAQTGLHDEQVLVSYAGAAELTSGREPLLAAANAQRQYDRELHAHAVRCRPGSAVPLGLAEIQRALGHTRVLMDLYLGADDTGRSMLTVVLVTDESADVIDLLIGAGDVPTVRELTILLDDLTVQLHPLGLTIADLRREIQDHPPQRRPVTRDGERLLGGLHAVFEGEVGARLDALSKSGRNHLCVWPHGPLHQLPFHLLGAATTRRPDRWTVTTVPSLRLIPPRPGAGAPPTAQMLSVGSASGGSAFMLPEVTSVEEQAVAIAKIFGTAPMIGSHATPDAVLRRMPGASRIHLAAHGSLNVAAPGLQCIYLAGDDEQDGRLFAHRVLRQDLRAVDLVTLSACESALGRHDQADNIRGFAEALFAAGVRTVVGCLWPVHPRPAAEFFTAFYHGLDAGMGKVESFGLARLQVRNSFTEYRDWGAFTYLGSWH